MGRLTDLIVGGACMNGVRNRGDVPGPGVPVMRVTRVRCCVVREEFLASLDITHTHHPTALAYDIGPKRRAGGWFVDFHGYGQTVCTDTLDRVEARIAVEARTIIVHLEGIIRPGSFI